MGLIARVGAVALTVGLAGCSTPGGDSQAPSSQPAKSPTKQKAAAGHLETGPSAMHAANAFAAQLPNSTLVLIAGADFDDLTARLGRLELKNKIRPQYEKAVAAITQATGMNLLEPKQLGRLGIDYKGPITFALVDPFEERFTFGLTLTDPEIFKTEIYRLAGVVGSKVETKVIADGLVIKPRRDGEIALVIRGNQAVFHLHDRHGNDRTADKFAELSRADSLAESPSFKAAQKRFASGRDAGLYVNTSAVIKLIVEEATGEARFRWMENDLAWAKNSGDPERIERVTRRLDSERARWKSQIIKHKATEMLVRGFFTGLGGVQLGLEIDGSVLRVAGGMPTTPKALPNRLLKSFDSPPALLDALDTPPFFFLAARFDVPGAWQLVKTTAVAAKESDEIDEFRTGFAGVFDMDFEKGFLPLLDGALAFVITADFDAIAKDPRRADEHLGGAISIGHKDAKAIERLLTTLAGGPARGLLSPKGERRWTLTIPYWRTGVLGLSENTLAAATDGPLLERALKGQKGAWGKLPTPKGVATLLSDQGQSVYFLLNQSVAGWLLSMDYASSESVWPIDSADVPPALQKELEALKAQIETLREAQRLRAQERQKVQQRGITQLVQQLGITAILGRATPDAFVVQGGQYTHAKSIAEYLATVVAELVNQDERRQRAWKDDEESWGKIRKLERQIAELGRRAPTEPAAVAE